ncbi:MAG TPA: N-acetylglucosamine-6-phosphate deacetylase [Amaricoccus sp.]|uniref:N-acetylglucosamine-6-phosphate deacetylase n=1 Tax=Amaricoccus sp. TaxID=1872485 RepID=UPI001DFE4FE4|nr:N-acetylglucosamine-6-phosphate deacetylase [Amaricoccus sp.]MCB1372728.1 N-acetylglucosamine-6-phosphate deacetylase [Paracoccaceae bacterium]MCB1402889.1 N-acetylglucosamine-6-phosphate deacetylase [Paracoccaceae bacterium]HPG21407.1 N-acetylglucosamine-6-phosphate deacetylase [Amaricoccus sp.]HRW15405.1 N-acetylglucosamine-6-phosphate deacetylase [Amaricoccus sp.]
MTLQVFRGAAIFDGSDLREGLALVVEAGAVAGFVAADARPDGEIIDLDGGILAPGFIDLQINGGGGVMLNDAPNLAGLARICAANARLGTTGLLPTLITDRPDLTRAAVEAGVAAAAEGLPGFLGLHLEGPHLDPRRKGAHDPALIRPMTPEDLAFLCDAAARLPALMVTLAPANATMEQIAALAEAGAIVSLGHAEARAAEARAAFVAGARMVTHLFNAMSPLGHREPGLVGAALDSDVHAGLIADGVHVDPATMRIALAAKCVRDRILLVTDAMAVAGTDLDEFNLNGRRIRRRDGRLTLDDGTLAGADIDIPGSLRVLVRDVGLPQAAALAMATRIPAELIGQAGRIGCLAPGARADLVHLGPQFELREVWRGGKVLQS